MKVKTFIAVITILWMTAGITYSDEKCDVDLEKEFGVFAQIKDVRREINLHNLFNGLHLTVDQMKQILSLAREASELRKKYLDKENIRACQIADTYKEILQCVSKGEKIPKPLEGLGFLMEVAEKQIKSNYFKAIMELEKKVWDILTPAQTDSLHI